MFVVLLFQKKAEAAHKVFEKLGPKIELVRRSVFVVIVVSSIYGGNNLLN